MEHSLLYLEYIADCFDLPVDVFVDRLHRYEIPNHDLVAWLKSMTDEQIDELILRPNTEERNRKLVLSTMIMNANVVQNVGELMPFAEVWGRRKGLRTWGEILAVLDDPTTLKDFVQFIEQVYSERTVKS